MELIFKIKHTKGYSLVEILVVLGLFSGIATLSLGALFNAQSVNARLQETQTILDNMNLSTQTITREIRFGTDFYGTTTFAIVNNSQSNTITTRRNCVECTAIIFKPSGTDDDLDRVAYYVSNGVLYKNVYTHNAATQVLQMTSNDVNVTSFTMNIDGANTSIGGGEDDAGAVDYRQPMVTLYLSGITRPAKESTPPATFNIETVVSAREIDNK